MPSDLTIDLQAYYNFTSNPNDSVNGLNLSEVNGPLSYGVNGVLLNGVDQSVTHSENVHFDAGDNPIMIAVQIIASQAPTLGQTWEIVNKGQDIDGNSEYFIEGQAFNSSDPSHTLQFLFGYAGGTGQYPTDISSGIYNVGDLITIIGMHVPGTGPSIFVNNIPGVGPSPEDPGNPVLNTSLNIGTRNAPNDFFPGNLRNLGIWIGPNAVKSQIDRTWLYNSGAGRTYAEILSTAPSGGLTYNTCTGARSGMSIPKMEMVGAFKPTGWHRRR